MGGLGGLLRKVDESSQYIYSFKSSMLINVRGSVNLINRI